MSEPCDTFRSQSSVRKKKKGKKTKIQNFMFSVPLRNFPGFNPWVFRIPGVFGEKSGPYSTIFLWVGFPFGGQKQGQNTPKLVLFEFLVTRAFSGGTIKKIGVAA